MSQLVVTIVGGGVFAPRLCEALAQAINLPEVELRLSARRADRLQILARHTARRLATTGFPGWSVRAVPSLEAALEGTTVVVLLVRVGGLEARAWDDAFPRGFGLAGDEGLGPGGIANAWRTLPELARMGRAIRQVAPGARVVNLMAPLGITTRCLLDQELDAWGLCELPLLTIESWLQRAGVPPQEATWHYGGLNHLGWFWDVRFEGQDLLRALAEETGVGGWSAPIDAVTLEHYDAAPLRYYYQVFDRGAGQRLGLESPPGRAEYLSALSQLLLQRYSETPGQDVPEAKARPTPWLDRAVAPVVAALVGGPVHVGFANLRNEEKIGELPSELVVEVAATMSPAGVCPVSPGPLPKRVAAFLRRAAEAETLAFQAAQQQDPRLLGEAVRALPLPIPAGTAQDLVQLILEGP